MSSPKISNGLSVLLERLPDAKGRKALDSADELRLSLGPDGEARATLRQRGTEVSFSSPSLGLFSSLAIAFVPRFLSIETPDGAVDYTSEAGGWLSAEAMSALYQEGGR